MKSKITLRIHVLAQFPFTTSELEMDVWVASWVVKRLKPEDFIKLWNFKKIPKCLGIDGKSPTSHPKAKIR